MKRVNWSKSIVKVNTDVSSTIDDIMMTWHHQEVTCVTQIQDFWSELALVWI
jgi:hypothetical protein